MSEFETLHAQASAQISAGTLDIMPLIATCDQLTASGHFAHAHMLYRQWLLANPAHPMAYVAAFNAGSHLLRNGQLQDARILLTLATQAAPTFLPARQNLAIVLEQLGEAGQAIDTLNHIVEQLAAVNLSAIETKISALKSLARLQRTAAPEAASAALGQAVEIAPHDDELVQYWIHGRQESCVWPVLQPKGKLQPSDLLRTMLPLAAALFTDDARLQLATAWRYSHHATEALPICSTHGNWPCFNPHRPDKIRIGYLSSDFCNHAIGYLINDVFALHDRAHYEIVVFNLSPPKNDAIQEKIRGQVDAWVELHTLSDEEAAQKILGYGIHILLDINGHTNYQRPRLLAMKPAPVVANWLGYPGTMGSAVHHYIIADDVIIPPSHESMYSERVLRLPCYQPNSPTFDMPAAMKNRAELGLPDQGIVYCCFNGAVKITPSVFSRWMHILRQVPGSVLWLRGAPAETQQRLQETASSQGVTGDRLVFLPFCSNTEYLSYHHHADVFLDTFPYGAHTTASDALRMGVPIVTLIGQSFASRVCASLSMAAGLDELVCESPQIYMEKAVALGKDSDWRQQIRDKLRHSLPACNLFNTQKLVSHLESLFETMWRAYANGELPQPQMPNLELLFAAAVQGADQGRDVSAFSDPQAATAPVYWA